MRRECDSATSRGSTLHTHGVIGCEGLYRLNPVPTDLYETANISFRGCTEGIRSGARADQKRAILNKI
jgi:hypothetical protein